jgi:formamidopyrimidine-DNA glycosylase
MPELPEVEVTRRGLLPHLLQRTIVSVGWSNKRLRLPIPRKLLQQHICNDVIVAIDRRAKYLLLRMQGGSVLVIHLGMTGKLGVFAGSAAGAKHDHLRLGLDDGMEMRFNDTRRFGSLTVWPPVEAELLEDAFNRTRGIEPLGSDFTAANLLQVARRRSMPVKSLLMDSGSIAGIGNIYANETLFAAAIHPQTPANSLSEEQWQTIVDCCQHILRMAIEAGGSTISDFIGSSGKPGYFQLQLAVYGKKNVPCPGCGTAISKKTLGGRATFFCAHCQPL